MPRVPGEQRGAPARPRFSLGVMAFAGLLIWFVPELTELALRGFSIQGPSLALGTISVKLIPLLPMAVIGLLFGRFTTHSRVAEVAIGCGAGVLFSTIWLALYYPVAARLLAIAAGADVIVSMTVAAVATALGRACRARAQGY